jgi:hypothetical protein
MRLRDMKLDAEAFDRTTLDEAEQAFVFSILEAISPHITAVAMQHGIIAVSQLVSAAVARVVKANLESGIQPYTIDDLKGRLKHG